MHSTSKSPALPRLTTKCFLIFTRYFPVGKVFSLSALSAHRWISVSVMKLRSVHLQVSFVSLFPVQSRVILL